MFFSKPALTNLSALLCIGLSYAVPSAYHSPLLYAGLFALSGALTNQIAIHMLFEKIPGLYGSGVIEKNFETFKKAIRAMVMTQFFAKEKIEAFFQHEDQKIDLAPLIGSTDFTPAFDALSLTVMESKFGGMVSMLGGQNALDSLREPFAEKLKNAVTAIVGSKMFKAQLEHHLRHSSLSSDLMVSIEQIVTQRLDELTPKMVKELVRELIGEHLGWLVIWGGVFGGLIGVASSLIL
ncbi:MAG: DUF445 domain-containing protein [Sulfurovum sp.]|nr:DUF445 domain-containing protein [Sulfurovum sp.]